MNSDTENLQTILHRSGMWEPNPWIIISSQLMVFLNNWTTYHNDDDEELTNERLEPLCSWLLQILQIVHEQQKHKSLNSPYHQFIHSGVHNMTQILKQKLSSKCFLIRYRTKEKVH
jgi:hypothetical protein